VAGKQILSYDFAYSRCHAAYVHSLTTGQTAQEFEPDGKAAKEILELYKWASRRVHTSTPEPVRMRA
jgi:chromosome partitioning protein